MAFKSRRCLYKFLYTISLWMTVSIACLWVINGINITYSSTSFQDRISVGETDDRKRAVKYARSLSTHLAAFHSNGDFEQGLESTQKDDNLKETDKNPIKLIIEGFEHEQTNNKLDNLAITFRHLLPSLSNRTQREMLSTKGNLTDKKQHKKIEKSQLKRRLPQALIIGVKKCGTRALLEYLRVHPDIRAPGPEPHFFDRYYHLGLNWYRSKMPMSNQHQLTIEKTPKYFVTPEVPERVYRMSHDVKLIIVVRDPVTRAISDFTQAMSKANDSVVLERKAFKCNGTGQLNTHWSGINTGLYITHVRRWLEYFPYKNMHFVSGENLIKNPAQELESIQEFLNLTRYIRDEHFYFNETKGFPCVKKDMSRPNFQCFNSRKGRAHIHVREDTLQQLRTFFEPYNKQFYKLVGRNFGW